MKKTLLHRRVSGNDKYRLYASVKIEIVIPLAALVALTL